MSQKALPGAGPPKYFSMEAEKATLGSMMLSEHAIDEARAVLTSRDFYIPAHQTLFRAILFLCKQGKKEMDIVLIKDRLAEMGKLKDVGGTDYLVHIEESVPTAANCEFYAEIVQAKAVLRRIDAALQAAPAILDDSEMAYDQKYDEIIGSLGKAMTSKGGREFQSLRKLQDGLIHKIDDMIDGKAERTGLMTGLTDFDRFLTGLYPSELYVIAARPAMGKTSLAMSLGLEICKRGGVVAMFSIEMGAEQLNERILAYEANINLRELRNAEISREDVQRIYDANERIRDLDLCIDDGADVSVSYMRAKCRRLKAEKGKLSLVIVDYLQLMRGSRNYDNRTAEVSDISRGLKLLSKELATPVMALCQLNRDVEKRRNKRPTLIDIRESGAIEQEADVVIFLYRDEYYKRSKKEAQQIELDAGIPEIAELIVAKNRNGPVGTCLLGFIPSNTRFCLVDEESKEAYREKRKI